MSSKPPKSPVTLSEFLKFNKLQRMWLKFTDKRLYKELKWLAYDYATLRGYCPPPLTHTVNASGGVMTFKHSGNAGDIIYALPTIRVLAGAAGAKLNLKLDVPLRDLVDGHPLGGVQLNRKMFEMLYPLLSRLPFIKEVAVHDGGPVDYDLDLFRDSPLPMDRIGICRWYFHMFGVTADLSQPWLRVEPDLSVKNRIVVARSHRYRNLTLNYQFLNKYDAPIFVGLEDEFEDFREQVPQAEWRQVSDFHQLARIIAGGRFFIGNQSFPFSLAEGIKMPRVLELDPNMPNVVPSGELGFDVLFQPQFERVVEMLWARPVSR